MSSHYNLRSQRSILSSQEPTIPGSLAESPLTESTTHQTAIVSPAESRKAEADESVLRPGRSYSDVVQTRSGTPRPEAGVRPASFSSSTTSPRDKTPLVERTNKSLVENPFLSTDESSEGSDDTYASWTTVDHRRRKSEKPWQKPNQGPKIRHDLVREATKLLTKEEKQRIHNRKRAEKRAQLREPGPSNPDDGPAKGKNPDPRNWGNLDLEESELDPGAQLEALRAWARSREEPREATNVESETTSEDGSDTVTRDPVQEAIKAAVKQATRQYKEEIRQLRSELKSKHTSQGKCPKTPMTKGTKESRVSFDPIQEMVGKAIRHPLKARGRHPTPPAVDATAQIAKKSYLGRAFKEVRRPEKQRSSRRNKDDSRDSSPSSSSSEYSSSTSSS